MRPWRAHWDRQLYKALEYQYELGLEVLNKHLPDIKIDLIYRYVDLIFKSFYHLVDPLAYFCQEFLPFLSPLIFIKICF